MSYIIAFSYVYYVAFVLCPSGHVIWPLCSALVPPVMCVSNYKVAVHFQVVSPAQNSWLV